MSGMSGMLKALGRGGKITKEAMYAAEAQREHPEITYDSEGAGWVSGYAVLHKSKTIRHLTLKACREEAARMRAGGAKFVYTVVDRWQICDKIAGKTKAKPAPAPDVPPILTAPPELAADMLGTGPMGLTPTAAPKRKPAARTTRKPKAKPAAKPKKTTKSTASFQEVFERAVKIMDSGVSVSAVVMKDFSRRSKYVVHVMGKYTHGNGIGIVGATSMLEITYTKRKSADIIAERINNEARKREIAKFATKPAAKAATKKPKPPKKTATAKPKAKPAATKKTAATPKLTAAQREYLAIYGFVKVKRGGKYVTIKE